MNHQERNTATVDIHTQTVQGHLIISFIGKLVYGSTTLAKNRLKELVGQADYYILDLENLQLIDSTGFGVIITFAKVVGIEKMAIAVSDEIIRELFSISKLNLLFPIASTVEEAINQLQNGFQAPLKLEDY